MIAALGLIAACGVSRLWTLEPRPAQATPERFVAPDSATAPGCRVVLLDPRDSTRLRLVRSTSMTGRAPEFLGDYSVSPVGRYGLNGDELLRVDCDRLLAMGVVGRS
jgi:hypothetical protein